MSHKRAKLDHAPGDDDGCEQCHPLSTPLGAPRCSMCALCVKHCVFGAEVCTRCGGHAEGLEVPGDQLYCEECACPNCGALYTLSNEYVEEGMCTTCYEQTG